MSYAATPKQQPGLHYFDNANRLAMDPCAIAAKNEANGSMSEYSLRSFYAPVCGGAKKAIDEFTMANPNLHASDGYGVHACHIAEDSQMKTGNGLTHPKTKYQLQARQFQGVPNRAAGLVSGKAANAESRLVQGQDTCIMDRVCDKYASRDLARFEPLLNPCWHLSKDNRISSASSRDLNKTYDAKCGSRPAPVPAAKAGR